MPVSGDQFSRVWTFVDHKSAGDPINRSDLDIALNDMTVGINAALQASIVAQYDSKELFLASGAGPSKYEVGSLIQVGEQIYKIASPSASNHHEITGAGPEGAGGLKVYESGGNFTTRARAQTTGVSTMSGNAILVDGLRYVANPAGTDLTTGDLRNWALIDVPEFKTLALMAASDTLWVGAPARVASGFNGEPEDFRVYASGPTANADTVITLTGISGVAVSLRREMGTVAAALADTRTYSHLTAGDTLRARSHAYEVVGASAPYDLLTAGSVRLKVQSSIAGFDIRAFGAVGDGDTDNTDAIQAAVNAASKSDVYQIWAPEGHFLFSEFYLFFDAVLNPGFDPTASFTASPTFRQGRFEFHGAGQLAISQMRDYSPTYGTVLEATGDGVVVSKTVGAPYPARAFTVRNMTLVANKAGKYIIESTGCPFMNLERVSLLQRNAAGHGVLAMSNWGLMWDQVRMIGTGTGHTGDGVVTGTNISAGGQTFKNCVLDNFRDNYVWTEGTWRSILFLESWLQGAERYSINCLAGSIDSLTIISCHHEGAGRTSDYFLRDVVKSLVLINNYWIVGDNTGTSFISGNACIEASSIGAVSIIGGTVFRPANTFMKIDAARFGGTIGEVQNLIISHDAGGTVSGPVTLFKGVLPEVRNLVYPGFAVGVEAAAASSNFELFDHANDYPLFMQDKASGATSIARLSLGQALTVTTDGGAVIAGDYNAAAIRVLNTSVSTVASFQLPTGQMIAGRTFFVVNDTASGNNVNVRESGGDFTSFAILAPGESVMVTFDKANNEYFALFANQEPFRKGKITGTTSVTGTLQIPHGLGVVPTFAHVTLLGDLAYAVDVQELSATNVTARVKDPATNADIASTEVTIMWSAGV